MPSKIEVTESIAVHDEQSAAETMRRLEELGVGLAIDDFGRGFAGVGTLRWMPATVLKIDRALIHDVATKPRIAAIVGGILGFAKAIGAISVAEGVETKAQLELLRSLGCDQVQGFLLSEPVPWRRVERDFGWMNAREGRCSRAPGRAARVE